MIDYPKPHTHVHQQILSRYRRIELIVVAEALIEVIRAKRDGTLEHVDEWKIDLARARRVIR